MRLVPVGTRRQAVLTIMVLLLAAPSTVSLRAEDNPFVAHWTANLSKSKRHPRNMFQSSTLQFSVGTGAVTITNSGLNAAGQEEKGVNTFQTDGKEHPFDRNPNVLIMARWVNPLVLETIAKKDGQVIGRATYEVSSDGQTLTAKIVYDYEQVIVFDRR